MLAFSLSAALSALLFVYIFMPSLWIAIMSVDDCSDVDHYASVAYSQPFFILLFRLFSLFPQQTPSERMLLQPIWPSSFFSAKRLAPVSSLFSTFITLSLALLQIQQSSSGRKRRASSRSRQPRTCAILPVARSKPSWIRFGKSFGVQAY
jgi:hypothetical protein